VARCLVIACGCRGLSLTRELTLRGHSVRASTRQHARLGEIERAGAEAVFADPDRVATLVPALEHVSVAYLLLGSVTGTRDALAALHTTRLDMLLSKLLDSTVRGLIYETAGTVPGALLAAGSQRVIDFCADSRVPYVLLRSEPGNHGEWLSEALAAADQVLAPRRP